uniref:Sulfotransferase domain-containing protein n=1 Tax=Chrysotila carterae TaxID=13221 RepID=A0A7S4ETV7_CHRCT|eukprot:2674855-Pleurochrysis_carterae.AAC.1
MALSPRRGNALIGTPEYIVFIRIQKTGSTSLSTMLATTFANEFNWTSTCNSRLLKCQSHAVGHMLPCSRRKVCFSASGVCGRLRPPRLLVEDVPHMTVADTRFLLGHPRSNWSNVVVLTSLRHPYTRTLSEYKFFLATGSVANQGNTTWFHAWDWKYNKTICGDYTLLNWLQCPSSMNGVWNRQTRMLSSSHWGGLHEDASANHSGAASLALTSAQQNLADAQWVGLLECPALSMCLLEATLGLRPSSLSLPSLNIQHGTGWAAYAEQVSCEEQSLLRRANEVDVKLVHFARSLMLDTAQQRWPQCKSLSCAL